MTDLVTYRGQGDRRDNQCCDADRYIDIKHPTPRGVLRQESTNKRTENRGRSKDSSKPARITPTVSGADNVSDDCLCPDDETTRSETLKRSKDNEFNH